MDITHVPRHVTCEVCCGKDDEYYMKAFEDGVFVHNPECLDEWTKLEERRNKNESNLVE
jgi:hypothetical protein